VNAGTASLTPPVITPIQLELFPGRACSPEAKPDTIRSAAGTKAESPGRCMGRRHAETDHSVNRRDPARSGGEGSCR
jgi:hypothetical protein